MVSVAEAFQIVQACSLNLQLEEVTVLQAIGRVLAEPIVADRDFPPFSRVAMDGIAIDMDQFKGVGQEFKIEAIQAAGSHQLGLLNPMNCIEVMTGAMLPQGTNVVIRYEDLDVKNGTAKILLDKIERGMNVHPRAQDAKKDEVLLTIGQKISAAEVALLASVGKSNVKVFSFPRTAVISSGDELVDITVTPEPHQIRRSNTYALQAAMKELHWESESFHLVDRKEEIMPSLRKILNEHDVLILSGGVSKGKFDFIPEVLEELGVQKRFHQVNQRPGKPFWFGTTQDNKKIVFALPGNPVSTFLCFYKYIKPWIMTCCRVDSKPHSAILAMDVNFSPSLTYFLQVRTESQNGKLMAYSHVGGGSGDFANLKSVDGFLELPSEKSTFKAGESYPFISFRV